MIMKNLKVLLLSSLLMIIGIATASSQNVEIVSKKYPIKPFSSIKANTVADIVFTQSDIVSMRIDGVQKVIDHLYITERKGVLIIESNIEFGNINDAPAVIFISSPNIEAIETYGMGNWCLKGKVQADRLHIISEGIGNIHALNLQINKIDIKHEGIGNIKIGGITELVQIFSGGVGNIDCENLLAKTAMVRSTKIGKVNCFASECIGIFNDGIGEIAFHGNPALRNLQNEGMGIIREAK